MLRRALIVSLALALVAGASIAAKARRGHAPLSGEGSGLQLVANVEYGGGTDMELITRDGRDYAVTGSAAGVGTGKTGAMRIIDVTDPEHPFLVSTLRCSLYQMDVQISNDGRTAILAADSPGDVNSCLAVGRTGFMTVDITDVYKPKVIGFAQDNRGSHNTTAHPTKPYVYNSDSDLAPGIIKIFSIEDPANPKLVNTVSSFPSSPHDISFNSDGTMAVTAAKRQIDLFDTSDPAHPVLLHKTTCPGCSLIHDAKFTPDSSHVIVGDEASGGGPYPCPGGALYFYALQDTSYGPALVPTGVYEPGEVYTASNDQEVIDACTSHVFDISASGRYVAVSWYSAGTRYLDISSMVGATFGGTGAGVREVGWFIPTGASSWASKFHDGPYIYSNDMNRGLDVFKITAK